MFARVSTWFAAVSSIALPTPEGAASLYLGLGALALALLLLLIQLLLNRRRHREIRQIVDTLEDLRSGKAVRRAEVPDTSPLASLSGAVNRLAADDVARREERHHASEGMQALLEASPECVIVVTDNDGDVRTLEGAATLFGWDAGAILGRPASALFDEDSWKELLPKLARREIREAGVETRATMLGKGGKRFQANVAIRQVRDASSNPDGFLLVVNDVSFRADLEVRLKEAEDRYTSLVEGLGEGIAILRETRILYANSALADMCGVPPTDLPGTLLRDRVATTDVLLLQERLGSLERR